MLNVPTYISFVFILTTMLTFYFCYRIVSQSSAKDKTRLIMLGISLWLIIQGVLAYSGVYRDHLDQVPPLFMMLGVVPTFIVMGTLLITKWGQHFLDSLPLKDLTWLSIVRIPVELCLYWLALEKVVPELMSFAGINYDIVAGLTVPFVIYFGMKKDDFKSLILWVWNIGGLILLLNIIIHAVLSAPFPTQQFAFDQPNLALLYFPFSWLGSFVAVVVLFSHFIWIRRLITRKY